MKTWSNIFACLLIVFATTSSDARRTHLTAEQKAQLEEVQTVFVNVLTLTEKGRVESPSITNVVKSNLEQIGYTIVTDRKTPHDVEFRVKCEERKTWTGTTASGGDAELADAPSRLWKGPACLFSYSLKGRNLGWYKEIRTDFEDSIKAAKRAQSDDPGAYALSQLEIRVQEYDFPVLITAEWGQVDRLLSLLDSPDIKKLRKVKILLVLNELNAEKALPRLTKMMEDKDLQQEAITALASTGPESIPLLIDIFQTSQQDAIRAAAAKALGKVAASTGDPRTIPPLIDYLKSAVATMETSEDINFPVLTEVVWSMGKLRDENSIAPMAELQKKIWLIYDNSPEMADLREAANWSYKQLDLDGHIS
jgi:hypothetical protein